MSEDLALWLLRAEGEIQAGNLIEDEVILGREVEDGKGITIDNHAISRHHGVFKKVKRHWLYKDLGSTNGSWINGVQLAPNRWRVVRPGDFVQLANTPLQIRGAGDGASSGGYGTLHSIGGRSLLVFSAEEFLDEYPVPEYGRALSIGGSQADLTIEADIYELPSLVIERRGDKICAFGVARELPIYLNDSQISDVVTLNDGDVVRVANYQVVFNEPSSVTAPGANAPITGLKDWNKPGTRSSSGGIGSQASATRAIRQSGAMAFGSRPLEEEGDLEETMALDPKAIDTKVPGTDVHPSMRYRLDDSAGSSLGSLTDKIMILVGVTLFFVLIILVASWMFLL